MPSSSRARCGTAALTSSGWVNSRSVWPTSWSISRPSISASDWFGVDDAAVVDADECHAGRGRVERLLEPTARLLERPRVLLALGQVAQPQHHPSLRPLLVRFRHRIGSVGIVGVAGTVEGGLDEHRSVVADEADRCRLDDLTGHRAAPTGPQLVTIRGIDEVEEERSDERVRFDAAQLGRRRVGRQHAAFGVEQHHGFGQFVEQSPHGRLGRRDPGETLAQAQLHPARCDVGEQNRRDRHEAEDDDRYVRVHDRKG